MGAVHYSNRTPSSAHEVALIFCADFSAECKRTGDMSNYYRWRMVMRENRIIYSEVWSDRLNRALTVAEKQQMDQLPLM